MAKTNWKKIITAIMNAEPPKGKAAYTYDMIRKKTGINTSTLSRLVSQPDRRLDYDLGLKLMSMYNDLKENGKLKK